MILNSNLHYQIFKFVIDNSDISLNCLQHIQKRRNFDAKVTCHQPICLLLHAILSAPKQNFFQLKFHFRLPFIKSLLGTIIVFEYSYHSDHLLSLPKNYFRKMEFSCKFQDANPHPILLLWDTGWVLSGPHYCVGVITCIWY